MTAQATEAVESGVETKRCTKCDLDKPVDEFYLTQHGRPRSKCAKCENQKTRKMTAARLLNRRAQQRATAALVQRHRAEFKALVKAFLEPVRAEFEQVDQDPEVRFRPGPKASREDQMDRIAPPKCEHCATHHEHGHSCAACGQAPEHDVPVYDVAEAGEVRFKRGQKVVIAA